MIPFKHGSAACVTADGSSGVVCYEKSVFCATCQHDTSSCRHVAYITNQIHEEMLPDSLKHWKLVAPQHKTHSAYVSCKSSVKIPFHFTKNQQEVLKKSLDERFNILNNLAILCPQSRISCPTCGNEGSENLTFSRESVVITETKVFQAKGMLYTCSGVESFFFSKSVFCRRCSIDTCHGEIHYCSQNQSCLLDMGKFFVAYEIFQRLLYHYVIGM